ncbi:MAG: FG-GAP-like repeat-containing protein [Pseudomonadota bacterium]
MNQPARLLFFVSFLVCCSLAFGATAPLEGDSPPKTEGTTGVNRDIFPKDMPNKLPEVAQNVDQSSGSFSWSIPIEVPSYYGIEPSLSLSYNSGGGNGIAGVGWSLSGYSTIERGGLIHTPPQYDDNRDTYYLDGQELVECSKQFAKVTDYSPTCRNVQSASLSLSGHFSTRIDSFQRIQKDGDTWYVFRKNGTKATYTNKCSTTSTNNSLTFRWGLSSVVHPNGATVTYESDCETGLTAVTYHGSAVRVELVHEGRGDPVFFSDGTQTKTISQRLKAIQVQVPNQGTGIFRLYRLFYSASAGSERSLLTSVLPCKNAACLTCSDLATCQAANPLHVLLPTVVNWYGGPVFQAPQDLTNVPLSAEDWAGQYRKVASGDFNGDGYNDLLQVGSVGDRGTYVLLGLPGGGFGLRELTTHPIAGGGTMNKCKWFGGSTGEGASAILTGDFNGDGRTDVLVQPWQASVTGCTLSSDFRPWLLLASGDGNIFQPAVDASTFGWISGSACGVSESDRWQCWDASKYEAVTGDFNGDRLTDLLFRDGPLCNGSCSFKWLLMAKNSTLTSGLFNRKDRDEVLGADSSMAYWDVLKHNMIAADFNGDGKTDLLFQGKPDCTGQCPGTNLLYSRRPNPDYADQYPFRLRDLTLQAEWNPSNVIPGDFNGDGLLDIFLQRRVSGSASRLLLNRGYRAFELGTGMFVSYDVNGSDWHADSRNLVAGDFNGDGKTDLIRQGVVPQGGSLPTDDNLSFRSLVEMSTGAVNVTFKELATLSGTYGSHSKRLVTGDFVGHGKTDLLARNVFRSQQDPVPYLIPSNTAATDRVQRVTNSFRGTTSVVYTPSAVWPGNQAGLPVTQTVKSLTVNDGRMPPVITEFFYQQGKYDYNWKRPLGFRWVRTKLPITAGESQNPFVQTKYFQEYQTAGMPEEVRYWEGDPGDDPDVPSTGAKLWTRSAAAPCIKMSNGGSPGLAKILELPGGIYPFWYIVFPEFTVQEHFDGVVHDPKYRTAQATVYDSCRYSSSSGFGNLVLQINYGVYENSLTQNLADDTTTGFQHQIVNTSNTYRVDRVVTQETRAGSLNAFTGTLLAITRFDYRANGNLQNQNSYVVQSGALTGGPYSRTYGYDDATQRNLVTETNEVNATTNYDYETTFNYYREKTRVKPSSTAAEQVTQVTGWDFLCGAPTSVKDPNGQITTTTYDGFCRVTQKQLPGGSCATPMKDCEKTDYSKLDDPTKGVGSGRYVETFTPPPKEAPGAPANQKISTRVIPDGLGRTIFTRIAPEFSANPIWNSTVYNSRGLVEYKLRPTHDPMTLNGWTRIFYDALNRPVEMRPDNYRSNAKLKASYEPLAQDNSPAQGTTNSYAVFKVTYTDEEEHTAADMYDGRGQVVRHDDSPGVAPSSWSLSSYDLLGNLEKIRDVNGNEIVTVFDSRGLLRRETDPDRGTTTFFYDAAGRLERTVDAKVQQVLFTYDLMNRKVRKQAFGVSGSPGADVTYKYDDVRIGYLNIGRLTTILDGTGYEYFDYDPMGRLLRTIRGISEGGGGSYYTYSQVYDGSGRLYGKYYPHNVSFTYGYDPFGRITSICTTPGCTTPDLVSSITYNAAGQPELQTNGNGTQTTYVWNDARGWLTRIRTITGSTVLQDINYADRNNEGMLKSWASSYQPNQSVVTESNWSFGYDSLHRLKTATNNLNSNHSESFDYDAIGNLTQKTVGTASPQTFAYAYDRTGGAGPHALTKVSGAVVGSYIYDVNGNMTNHAGDTITFNAEGYPARFVRGGQTTSFTYDGNNQRLMMSVTGVPGPRTIYLDGGAFELRP